MLTDEHPFPIALGAGRPRSRHSVFDVCTNPTSLYLHGAVL